MSELVLPGAEIDRKGWNGSGSHPAGGVDLLTHHQTQSPHGTLEGARSTLHTRKAESTWLVEIAAAAKGGRRIVQLVDANRAAKSLRNTSAPGQTNKAGTVQVEVVGYSEDPVAGTTPDDWRWYGREFVGPVCALVDIPATFPIRFYVYPPDRLNPPQYLGREFYRTLPDGRTRGNVAHMHWDENSHGDTGDWSSPDPRLGWLSPIDLILQGVAEYHGVAIPPATPKDTITMEITPASLAKLIGEAVTKATAGYAHAGKAVCARDNRDGRVWVISGAGKFHAVNRDILAGLMILAQLRPVDFNKIPAIDGAKYLEHLPVLATGADVDDAVDELRDIEAAREADLEADGRALVAALEELTAAHALGVGEPA